ncbi:unnamed protein product, partial [Hapterophycus canaliculatus]
DSFSVQVFAGETITIDVDAQHRFEQGFVTINDDADTTLSVLDHEGLLIAFNDNAAADDDAFSQTQDSHIAFTVPVDGEYFFTIGRKNDD